MCKRIKKNSRESSYVFCRYPKLTFSIILGIGNTYRKKVQFLLLGFYRESGTFVCEMTPGRASSEQD